MAVLDWSPLTEADLPALMALAQDCLDADGGLPQLATGPYLRDLFLSDVGIAGRDDTTELLAAAALGRRVDRRTATGMVHPSARRQGHGEHLVQWCRDQAGAEAPLVIAETMSIEAESLFAASGFHRVFAESVMRHKLKAVPRVRRPEGITTRAFGPETASDFFAAFAPSFADRPAYRPVSEQEWLAELLADPTFRPRDSRVAYDEQGMPVGFVIVCDGWIDQVGVVPEWRGQALGAHLVARSLTALRKAGTDRVYLCVNVDNPSRTLYERLGFRVYGTRARYESR
jgi:mycothiol synthase